MCARENLMEIDMKKLYGYYSNQIMKEVSKGLELKAYGYRKMVDTITKETQMNFEEMIKDWNANRDFIIQDTVGRPSLIKGSSIIEKMDRTRRESENMETINEKSDKRMDSDSD